MSVSKVPLGVSTSVRTYARTETCKVADKSEIAALFDRWNESLQTGDPEKVVANYATKSVLLPTLSSSFCRSQKEKLDYFKRFLETKPVGRVDSRMIEIGCNMAIDTGLYSFAFSDGTSAKARYTFTYRWDGRQWLISSHHSSVEPDFYD